jgi:hypothetical protein
MPASYTAAGTTPSTPPPARRAGEGLTPETRPKPPEAKPKSGADSFTPSLTESCTADIVATTSSLTALRVTVTFENTSERRVYALASWFNVVGSHIHAAPSTGDGNYRSYVKNGVNSPQFKGAEVFPLPRHWDQLDGVIVDCGRVLGNGEWFERNEKKSTTFMVYVPSRSYDLISIDATTSISKTDDGVRTRIVPSDQGGLGGVTERQYGSGSTATWKSIMTASDPRSAQWIQKNGVAYESAHYELSLWPQAAK